MPAPEADGARGTSGAARAVSITRRAMHAVLSGLFLLGAVWSFIQPVGTFFALASVLGLLLLLQGMSSITQSIALRDVPRSGAFCSSPGS